jgi:hypothetical protein
MNSKFDMANIRCHANGSLCSSSSETIMFREFFAVIQGHRFPQTRRNRRAQVSGNMANRCEMHHMHEKNDEKYNNFDELSKFQLVILFGNT